MRECTRVSLQLSRDQRLVAGVGGALSYFANRAGLEERSRESLVAALEEFCLEAAPAGAGTAERLDVAIEDFEDRIEIVVERHFAQESSGDGPERGALWRLERVVDRVERDTNNGSIRTRVVKFL